MTPFRPTRCSKRQPKPYLVRRDAQPCAYAPHARVGRRHVRVGTEVDVKHRCVRPLHQDPLSGVKGGVGERDCVLRHAHKLNNESSANHRSHHVMSRHVCTVIYQQQRFNPFVCGNVLYFILVCYCFGAETGTYDNFKLHDKYAFILFSSNSRARFFYFLYSRPSFPLLSYSQPPIFVLFSNTDSIPSRD